MIIKREINGNAVEIALPDYELYDAYLENWNVYNPETGGYVDTFDYEAAGLLSPDDCDELNTPRLCCGCKYEYECCGVRSF